MEQETIDIEIPAGKIYKERAIRVGTLLGGPLIAGYLIASNFKTFNEPNKAKKTWIYAIIATIVIFGGIFLIPESIKIPNPVIPIVYTSIAVYLVKHFQGKQIESHTNAGGQFYNWWRVMAVALIGLAIILIAVFCAIYFSSVS